ncbi:hypothetical protein CTAYLR_004539 [Chrysophaeum taylorii]|uniref:Polycystin domain-containing protein n=1 Tax=Chrysophaeum taylorii TaxID=2483200 RepID=A0AAD7XU22_9STRA|nr:hypothetical protein CTAYLR_004539 [Chrysophaeum taylorii]
MWLHIDVRHAFELEHAVEEELTIKPFGDHSRTYYDVGDAKEFWKWIEDGLLPTVVTHEDAIGNTLPREEWRYFVEYNRVIGGIRIYQKRSEKRECHYKKVKQFYDACHPVHALDKSSFGYPDCSSEEFQDALDDRDLEHNLAVWRTGCFEMWVDLLDTDDVVGARLDYLKERRFVDKQTKSVTIELLLLNAQTDPLLCRAFLELKFDRVGRITPLEDIETVPVDPYHSDLELKVFKVFSSKAQYGDSDEWSKDREDVAHFESRVGVAITDMFLLRRVSVMSLYLLISRLFEVAWDGIPGYESVSTTLEVAKGRLLFFGGVIFGCLVLVFAGGGMLAFGQQLHEFHTYSNSIVSTLIVITTGDADLYEKQHIVDPFLANRHCSHARRSAATALDDRADERGKFLPARDRVDDEEEEEDEEEAGEHRRRARVPPPGTVV